jgi:hypothetical protein
MQKLTFPTAINHATLSPDGDLLVACGDLPRAFFCRRKPPDSFDSKTLKFEFEQIAAPRLTGALPDDMCFSTAFSPSGHVCAIGSQGGKIIIFDTKEIREDMEADEAVLDVLSTSRPVRMNGDLAGAVRSMAFSPEPWELFAWAEDQGRVCVTDLRGLRGRLMARQMIELETSGSDGVERANVSDFTDELSTAEQRELEIEARLIQRHEEAIVAQGRLAASATHTADSVALASQRRRLQIELYEAGQAAVEDATLGLTETERQVLDTLRIQRQRYAERAMEREYAQRALERASTELGTDYLDRPFSIDYSRPRDIDSSTPSSAGTHNTSLRQYMRERNIERALHQARPLESRTYTPRRRSSVMLSNRNTTTSSEAPSLAPITSASNLSVSPSQLPPSLDSVDSPSPIPNPWPGVPDPWVNIVANASVYDPAVARDRIRDLENLRRMREWERERQGTSTNEGTISGLEARIQAGAIRSRATRLRLQSGGPEEDSERVSMRRTGSAGVTTVGVGWSGDGRLL